MKDLNSFSFIFVGDTHGFINDFEKQKEVINSVNPEFVLAEQLQDLVLDSKEKYAEIFKTKTISEMVLFEEVKDLIEFCHKKGIKLIGIDLRNFGFNAWLQAVIKNKKNISEQDEIKINEIIKIRQKYHLEIINKYKSKTSKPVVVILGAWHLQESSLLMRSLHNYAVFYPSDENGNLVVQPPKNKISIRYAFRVVKK